jgi:hypothetical protein
MASKIDKKGETRKTWVTPELRKTSIEQITASAPNGTGFDGGIHKPNIFFGPS